jgi:hypothetical protein
MSLCVLTAFFGLILLLRSATHCQAAPVIGSQSHPLDGIVQPKEDLSQLSKDWLTLAPSSSVKDHARNLDQFGHFVELPPHDSHHQRTPNEANLKRPLHSHSGLKEKGQITQVLADTHQSIYVPLWEQKKIERQIWKSKHKDRSLPLQLYSSDEIKQMGVTPHTNRYHAILYLEEQQRRKEKIDWRHENIPKPSLPIRFNDLKGHAAFEDDPDTYAHLIKKQREMDHLLREEGLLSSSDPDKKSDLLVPIKRQRRIRAD